MCSVEIKATAWVSAAYFPIELEERALLHSKIKKAHFDTGSFSCTFFYTTRICMRSVQLTSVQALTQFSTSQLGGGTFSALRQVNRHKELQCQIELNIYSYPYYLVATKGNCKQGVNS